MTTAFDPSKFQLDQIPNMIELLQNHLSGKRLEALSAAVIVYMTTVHNHKITLVEAVKALDTPKKLAAAGITFSSGTVDEQVVPKTPKPRAKNGTAAPKAPKPYVSGQQYKNPNSDAVWTGGTKGRMPPWLSSKFKAEMSFEEKATIFQSMAVD